MTNVPFQIAVHDGEEDLKEEVDGIDKHRYQVEPRFARHDFGRGFQENASVMLRVGMVVCARIGRLNVTGS